MPARRSSASASPTFTRMPARSVSRPVQTALVAFDTEVSWRLHGADRVELLADPGERAGDRRGVDVDLVLLERRQREQAGQPDRGLEVGGVGRLGIDDARGRRRRPSRTARCRSARGSATRPRRRRPRRGCRAPRAAPRASRAATSPGPWPRRRRAGRRRGSRRGLMRQHEVALLRAQHGAGLRRRSGRARSPAPRASVAEQRLEQVLEVAALGGRPGALVGAGARTPPRSRRAARGRRRSPRRSPGGTGGAASRAGSGRGAGRPSSGRRRSTGRAGRRCGRSRSHAASRRTAR